MRFRIVPMLFCAAYATYAVSASAQEHSIAPALRAVTEETTSQATGPSMMMVGSGVAILGLSYLPVVVVGATSSLDADRSLFVPIAGPWIDFANRPGCSPDSQCNTENTIKVLLAADGVLQAVGALTIVGGLLTTAHETKTVRTARIVPKLQLAPAHFGSRAYGVVGAGEF